MKAVTRRILLLALACVLGAMLFLGGYVVGDRKLGPYDQLKLVEGQARGLLLRVYPKALPTVKTREIETIFVRLKLEEIRVPGSSLIWGGGLTMAGDQLLLMSGAGEYFFVDGEQTRPLAIGVPENHRADYEAAARKPELAGLLNDFDRMRYYDTLFVESDAKRWLYLSYIDFDAVGLCYSIRLARLDVTSFGTEPESWRAKPEDWQVFFRTQPCLPLKHMNRAIEGHISGGRLTWDPADHRLYFSSGDFHWDGVYNRDGVNDPKAISQEPDYQYGKILKVDPESGVGETVSIGNRNAQGLYLAGDGTLWETEHGPRGGDELNVIQRGKNYGWPLVTLGTRYDGLPWTSATQYGRHEGYEGPIFAWVPSKGISNLIQIQGVDPSWDGDLLVSFLGGRELERLRIVDRKVIFSEPIEIGQRIRDLLQLPDGRIVLWTDSRELIYLSKSTVDSTRQHLAQVMDKLSLTGGRRQETESALNGCLECHSLSAGNDTTAPSLAGVYGRPIASSSFAGYSPALKSQGGRWNRKRLQGFLQNPQEFASGTLMPKPPMSAQAIDDLIDVLEGMNVVD